MMEKVAVPMFVHCRNTATDEFVGGFINNTMVFAAKHPPPPANNSRFSKRERPYCTHCRFHGHTIDKCFKLHGYPPGYKPCPKPLPPTESVNQVSHDPGLLPSPSADSTPHLTPIQYQHLLQMLSSHMSAFSPGSSSSSPESNATLAGTCYNLSLISSAPLSSEWVVDSGASRHICCTASDFSSLHPISKSTVTLPNNSTLHAHFAGNIQLNSHLTLTDVLFLPQFHFNLLSVSSLTSMSNLKVTFLSDSFSIQETRSQNQIGKGSHLGDLYILDATPSNISVNYVHHTPSA
ncbi:hypothetical protein DH2020_038072 [Rehmannia glutinosa]|uniref:Retrovirus-related Pol polyprotein from transposon TNT 1-94-like beta-barrel domain-containing protein n=1 Tax=Rehmannia glutinosa TaxID=99300 RepID=A0ABR0UZL7_REHGL